MKSRKSLAGEQKYYLADLSLYFALNTDNRINYGPVLENIVYRWASVIRLPDFVTKTDFDWAVEAATKKKKIDCSPAEMITVDEGLCVQVMYVGSYDDEPATVALMDAYLAENGYKNDLSATRLHHEIYLSDPRKTASKKLKTVVRHPIRKTAA